MTRRLLLPLLVALACTWPAAATASISLPDVEDEVMCVSCRVPLNIAESPQADRQRAYIQSQIDSGASKEQIKDRLVAQYGREVLALPDDDGFGITAYAIPIALVVLLAGGLAVIVPRWRRRGATIAPEAAGGPVLSAGDARRLDDDLARYET